MATAILGLIRIITRQTAELEAARVQLIDAATAINDLRDIAIARELHWRDSVRRGESYDSASLAYFVGRCSEAEGFVELIEAETTSASPYR